MSQKQKIAFDVWYAEGRADKSGLYDFLREFQSYRRVDVRILRL